MPHLLDLTIGTMYKGNDGEEYKIIANWSDEKKHYIELEKVGNVELQELIKEN